MGWWSISESMVNGDGPADHMDNAIDKIVQEYLKSFGRKPYKEELQAILEFSTSSGNFVSSEEKMEHGPGINWEVNEMKKQEMKKKGDAEWKWN